MDRAISVEEKIRRAEEIYNRRRENDIKYSTARVNVGNKKDFKLLKKMFIQIIICLIIYCIFYICVKDNDIISKDLKDKTMQILNYDLNFAQIYNTVLDKMKIQINEDKQETSNIIEENIGGSTEEIQKIIQEENQSKDKVNEENQDQDQNQNQNQEQNEEEKVVNDLSQMEQDALDIKKSINFIIPVTGTVTSTFGWRNPTTSTVPKYHTGLDIAAETGTKIKASTDGTVILNSDKGDFGKHLKIQNGDVIIIYAHCNELYVKEGDTVVQGQEIAEVGSTGNSTGPHLHFEIRKQDRHVDPQLILQI